MRLMKTLDILQSNGCITMRRGRFFARSGTAFLDNLPQETVDDEFIRASAGAVRDKSYGVQLNPRGAVRFSCANFALARRLVGTRLGCLFGEALARAVVRGGRGAPARRSVFLLR